jgi:hypothetical protein
MGVEFLQSNLTAGELDPRLHGRTDIEKYASGVAEATNMVILPYGGLRRRPGLAKITDSKVSTRARLLPFVFNTEQTYLIVLRPLVIDIYKEGELVSTEVTNYTESDLFDIDAIQSADTMIFAHQSHPPKQLQRQGSDTAWEFKSIVFANLPYYNFGTVIIEKWVNSGTVYTVSVAVDEIVLNRDGNDLKGLNYTYYKCKVARASIDLSVEDFSNTTNWTSVGSQEPAWSATRGYPRTCTFFGNRLWFAGSTSQPTSIWGSKISGFFDFDLNDGDPDDAIADILDTDQYDIIQNIFAGRQLQVFTSGGEIVNKADPVTPETSAWKKQTGYGSVKIKPILIDGATLFIDSSKRTVRQFLYDYNEDGNVSINASLLSSHLITSAVAMSAITGTIYDVGDYVYVVNEDGSVAVLNTMRSEKITGWTHWVTDGRIEDVCVVGKVVYFLVERAGSRFIEILKEGTYTDHNVLIEGTPNTTYEVVDGEYDIIFGSDTVIYTDITSGTPVTEIQTDYDNVVMNKRFKVVADYSIMGEFRPEGVADDNKFTINRDAYRLEVGLNYLTKIKTLPLATGTMKGTTYHRRKRVVKVDINVLESLGVYARNSFSGDRQFTVVLDRAPTPFTGFKEMYLLGYSRLAEIEISQQEPLPFTLRAIGYEIEY